MNKYRIRYRYINPSSAGPLRGKAIVDRKHDKGETIIAIMDI